MNYNSIKYLFQILSILLPLIHSESSILGFAGYRPGLGYNHGYNRGYNYGYNQVYSDGYNQVYNGGYNQVYRGGYNPGYNARYNPQRIKFNNPIVNTQHEEPIHPAFNSVPAVPNILTSPHESSFLPEPIFAVENIPALHGDVAEIEPIATTHAQAPGNDHPIATPVPDSSSSSQFHAQDEYGNHEYGYKNMNSAKHEVGSVHGGVRGSYSWRDEAGYHTVNYVADENGYRIVK